MKDIFSPQKSGIPEIFLILAQIFRGMANKTKITKTKKICKLCKNELAGRLGKVFCSIGCKNEYHVKLRRVNKLATNNVDLILHRNRSILLEVMGKNSRQKKTSRLILDKKKFN